MLAWLCELYIVVCVMFFFQCWYKSSWKHVYCMKSSELRECALYQKNVSWCPLKSLIPKKKKNWVASCEVLCVNELNEQPRKLSEGETKARRPYCSWFTCLTRVALSSLRQSTQGLVTLVSWWTASIDKIMDETLCHSFLISPPLPQCSVDFVLPVSGGI